MELAAEASLVINVLLAIVMYFFKEANDSMKERMKNAENAISSIRDNYIKKEDFREFKEELFVRLDEMKLDFRQEIERLRK